MLKASQLQILHRPQRPFHLEREVLRLVQFLIVRVSVFVHFFLGSDVQLVLGARNFHRQVAEGEGQVRPHAQSGCALFVSSGRLRGTVLSSLHGRCSSARLCIHNSRMRGTIMSSLHCRCNEVQLIVNLIALV